MKHLPQDFFFPLLGCFPQSLLRYFLPSLPSAHPHTHSLLLLCAKDEKNGTAMLGQSAVFSTGLTSRQMGEQQMQSKNMGEEQFQFSCPNAECSTKCGLHRVVFQKSCFWIVTGVIAEVVYWCGGWYSMCTSCGKPVGKSGLSGPGYTIMAQS